MSKQNKKGMEKVKELIEKFFNDEEDYCLFFIFGVIWGFMIAILLYILPI